MRLDKIYIQGKAHKRNYDVNCVIRKNNYLNFKDKYLTSKKVLNNYIFLLKIIYP